MMPPMLGQRGSCRTCSDRSQWSPPRLNFFFTRFKFWFFRQPGQLTMSAISFTWTMSPNCEASSSTCLWRLVFIVPPRMNTTLLGPKLVIEGRDCRDNLRDGGDTFLGKPIGGNQTYPKTKQNQLNWDQPWFKPGSLACPPTPAYRLTINQVAHCAARF